MTELAIEELVVTFREFTPAELSEFVRTFEEGFDVTAAAPVTAVAATPVAGGKAAAVEGERDSLDIVPEAIGDKKIAVIKEIHALTSPSLEETKDFVDSAPETVLEGVGKEAANRAREQLEGADVSIIVK